MGGVTLNCIGKMKHCKKRVICKYTFENIDFAGFYKLFYDEACHGRAFKGLYDRYFA